MMLQVPTKAYRLLLLFAITQYLTRAVFAEPCFGGLNDQSYQNWIKDKGDSYSVSACYTTTSNNASGVAIHWRVDDNNVYLAVAARATGWVGFGLAEAGGMRGADMVIYETANPNVVRDAHVLDARIPLDDICNDWVYLDSYSSDGFLIFEAYRKLDTLDPQDRAIINDSNSAVPAQLVVAAWGDTETATYHDKNNVIRGSLRWYGTGDELLFVKERLAQQADGYFDLRVNYTILPQETEYHNFCFNWDPDLTSQDIPNSTITIIAAEVLTTEESRRYVHHADVYGANIQSNMSRTCLESGYGYSVYSWATGIHPFILPDNVGYVFGPTADNSRIQSFRMQIHYNNPELVENVTDNTALRVYYTLKPREHELAIMAMGDVLSKLDGSPIPAGVSQYDFSCPSDCSSVALTIDEPITVFQEGFHMHIAGVSAATYHIRNDKIIRESHIDFYDFDQAGLPTIRQEPFTVLAGDSFISKFWFNTKNGTEFGQSSYQEMLKAVFIYYPAKDLLGAAPWSCVYKAPIGACDSTMSSRELSTLEELDRKFGKPPSQCYDKATLEAVGAATSISSEYDAFGAMVAMIVTVLISLTMLIM